MDSQTTKKLIIKLVFAVVIVLVIIGLIYYSPKTVDENEVPEFDGEDLVFHEKEDQAFDLVKELPDVKNWLALFTDPDQTSPVTGGIVEFELAGVEGEVYTVHVFEVLDDRIVTFGWYEVDLENETVKKIVE